MAINKTNIEIERKCYINQDKYDELINHFDLKNHIKTQINHYFDTFNFELQKKGIVLRIRQKDHQYKLTSKTPVENGLVENHVYLTEDQALDMIKNGFDAKIINIPFYVKKVCDLKTNRAKISYHGGELFIDQSIYFDQVDYEIEFEANNHTDIDSQFKAILADFNIIQTETPPKVERAFNRALKIYN